MGEKSTNTVLLCGVEAAEGSEMAFVQFIKCVPSLNAVNGASGYICLQWKAESAASWTNLERLQKEENRTAARK